MKKVAYGIGGLVVLLIAAALIVPSFIDWNAYKPEIAAQAKKATGRTLDIRGDIELAVLPSPHLTIEDAHLSNAPGATSPDMVALKALRVDVKFAPLLQGKVEVASIELIEPVIEIEKMADGTTNLAMTPAPEAGASADGSQGAPAPSGEASGSGSSDGGSPGGAGGFSLDSLKIVDGTVVYRDKAAGTVERIGSIDAEISAASLKGPFTLKGDLTARDMPLTLDVQTGRFAERGAVPVTARIGIAGNPSSLTVKGTVTDAETAPKVAARIDASGPDLGALIAGLSGSAPGGLGKSFSLGGNLNASETEVTVADLALDIGGSKATGQIKAQLGEKIRANMSLRSEFLDLDALAADAGRPAAKPAPAPAPQQAAPQASKPAPAGTGGNMPAPAEPAPKPDEFALPADIDASVDLTVVEAKYRDGRIRDIRLAASLHDGRASLDTLSAQAPGGAQLEASGSAAPAGGKLAYNARLSARASSLRTTLEWLQVDVSAVAADRLRRMSLGADVSGNAEQVQIANIQMQLDATRVQGGVTVALRDRPAFGASINVDQFNADAYMPPSNGTPDGNAAAQPAASGASGTEQTGQTAQSTANSPAPAQRPAPEKGPLAALNDFDANLAVRVGSLTYQRTTIQGIQLDGTLVGGVLTLRDASVRNLAGTSAQIKGTLKGFDAFPSFDGTVAAASNDLTGLFQVAGIESPVPPARLGEMRLSSRTEVNQDRVNLNATLQIAEIRANVTGTASGLPAAPVFDIAIDAQHPEMARLGALFGDGKPGPAIGRAALKATAKGDMNAVNLDADASLAGGSFKFGGRIDTPTTAPKFDLALALQHPDFVRFVKAFDPGFAPGKANMGSLKIEAALKGDDKNLAIDPLKGNVGPTTLSGKGSYRNAEPRPVLDLALTAGEIPLGDFLGRKQTSSRSGGSSAPQRSGSSGGSPGSSQGGSTPSSSGGQGGGEAPAQGGSGRWSREPIDTAALGIMDANIDVGAEAVIYDNYRVDNPKIVAVLKDKVLDIREVTGRMFEGGFAMKGVVDGSGVPAMRASVQIDDAKVKKPFFGNDSFDIQSGNLTQSLMLAARGNSEYDMIRTLNGNGTLKVTNGTVTGIDLATINEKLKGGNVFSDIGGLLSAIQGAIGSGKTTAVDSLSATYTVKDGVVQTNDLALVSAHANASASGNVNLPSWNMDFWTDVTLNKLKDNPKFRFRTYGPIDKPNYNFDVASLAGSAVSKGVNKLLEKVIPGAKEGGGDSGGDQQQQNPADAIKNLLKGFGR